jgi:hypothetical protein
MNKGVFFGIGLKGSTAPVIPVLQSAEAYNDDDMYISLEFNAAIKGIDIEGEEVLANNFCVKINSEIREILNSLVLRGGDSTIYFYASGILYYGDIITVSYTAPLENPLQGVDGGLVASFVDYPVTNNIEAP